MKCLMRTWRPEPSQFSQKNHLFYPFVIESLYLSLLCLSEGLFFSPFRDALDLKTIN